MRYKWHNDIVRQWKEKGRYILLSLYPEVDRKFLRYKWHNDIVRQWMKEGRFIYCLAFHIWAVTCDFQQCGILTCADSDEPVQPPFKLRSSKWCSVSSLTLIEYSSDKQRLWSDCAYAQADLSLCSSHIPYCWNSHVAAQFVIPRGR